MKNPSGQSMLLQQAQKTLLNLSAFYTSGGQDLHALHSALAQAESLAIGLRTVYEAAYCNTSAGRASSTAPILQNIDGRISVNEYGWLHIELAMLLPHCQYQTPHYLIDTLERLLDGYAQHHQLPWFSKALLATMSLTLKGRGKNALLKGSYPSYNEGVIGLTGHCLSFYARTGKL